MKSEPTPAWIRVLRDRTAWRTVDEETIALDLESSTYFGLNPAASTLWPALVQGTTRKALIDRLMEAFDVSPEQAEHDVDVFLAACRSRGLLEG